MIIDEFLKLENNDIVVCIYTRSSCFDINEKYQVESINLTFKHIYLYDKFGDICAVNYQRFILLKEYEMKQRKDKINKLLK